MKQVLLCVVFSFLFLIHGKLLAQESSGIVFESCEHDFKEVKTGEKVSFKFDFVNNSPDSVRIIEVVTQCGCTTGSLDEFETVGPGEKGKLEVVFDTSDKSGFQRKAINVKFDNFISQKLIITANVVD